MVKAADIKLLKLMLLPVEDLARPAERDVHGKVCALLNRGPDRSAGSK
jgi:hypothetical protein